MYAPLKQVLEIQELDIKMIRLMRLKKQRQNELAELRLVTSELKHQHQQKKLQIQELSKEISSLEEKLEELKKKIKHLEQQQASIKKIDEFNAITQEMTLAERNKTHIEQEISNIIDKKNSEEEILDKIDDKISTSEQSGSALEEEIQQSIQQINEEGRKLKEQRDLLAKTADLSILEIYERLLKNKKDRVIVPLVNRICTGCFISLTPQHENLVRRGEKLVFCEHCSRIHYWQESEELEGTTSAPRKRRRKSTSTL